MCQIIARGFLTASFIEAALFKMEKFFDFQVDNIIK